VAFFPLRLLLLLTFPIVMVKGQRSEKVRKVMVSVMVLLLPGGAWNEVEVRFVRYCVVDFGKGLMGSKIILDAVDDDG
jgi:hypothetical protein